MTDKDKLIHGFDRVAWGYFFLYFDINFGTVSGLPDFVGFILFLSAIKLLHAEERELILLKPLGIFLLIWEATDWIMSFWGGDLDELSIFFHLLFTLANLYFQFQLITNLASIASQYQPIEANYDAKLLTCRSMQTIIITGIAVLTDFGDLLGIDVRYITGFTAVVYIIAVIFLMKALFGFRKYLMLTQTSE